MIKKLFVLFLVMINFQIQLFSQPKRSWTFLTYIAADNDLNSYVNQDLKEMMAGTNNNVNTLVYLNTKSNNKKKSKKLIVNKDAVVQQGDEVTLDSGIPSTLLNAIKWAIEETHFDYFALDLWNHGSGPLNPAKNRGVCFDDTTGNYLNDKDLQFVLKETVKMLGKKIDILCFDACLMASIEGDVSWAEYVNYVVGSEQTIPGYGWGYDKVLKLLQNNPLNPRSFAIGMVNSYKQTYIKDRDYTMSAVDTANIKKLAENVDDVGKSLTKLLSEQTAIATKNIVTKSRKNTTNFAMPYYIDLNHFYLNLLVNINAIKFKNKFLRNKFTNLKTLLNSGINLINQNVINNVSGPDFAKAAGISIYFPMNNIDQSYPKLDWSEKYPGWLMFLRKFLSR